MAFNFFASKRVFRDRADAVEVCDERGVRRLFVAGRAIQSAMRIDAPFELELEYTRAMMAALLFQGLPREALLIGLGGGSLAKFLYQQVPGCHITAIEISAQVIAVARGLFFLPEGNSRLRVIEADGAEYLGRNPANCDLLLVDAYQGSSPPEVLTRSEFFANCKRALSPDGIAVINFWSTDKSFTRYRARVDSAFNGLTLQLPTRKHANVIMFAFTRRPPQLAIGKLEAAAKLLETQMGIEFGKLLADLKCANRVLAGEFQLGLA